MSDFDSPNLDGGALDGGGLDGGGLDGGGGVTTLPLSATESRPVPQVSNGDGDHERFAHYAPKDKIVEAAVMGTPITALCGKVWVPSRDPKRFPVCPDCKDIYDNHLTGEPSND